MAAITHGQRVGAAARLEQLPDDLGVEHGAAPVKKSSGTPLPAWSERELTLRTVATGRQRRATHLDLGDNPPKGAGQPVRCTASAVLAAATRVAAAGLAIASRTGRARWNAAFI